MPDDSASTYPLLFDRYTGNLIIRLSAILLLALSVPAMALFPSASFAQTSSKMAPVPTTPGASQEDEIQATIDKTTKFLGGGHKEMGGLKFTPRWSSIMWLGPSSTGVLFADCLPGEFAVQGMDVLQDSDLRIVESHAVALPGDSTSWLYVISNTNANERLPAAVGTVCLGEITKDKGKPGWSEIYRPEVRQKVDLIINNIAIVDVTHINIQQVVSIRQAINQIAIQVADSGGNVTQVIDQMAGQASQPAGSEDRAAVEQLVGQLTNQTMGNSAAVNQTINRLAEQAAKNGRNDTMDLTPPTGEQAQQNATEGMPENPTKGASNGEKESDNNTQANNDNNKDMTSAPEERETPKAQEDEPAPEEPTEPSGGDTDSTDEESKPAEGGSGNATLGQ